MNINTEIAKIFEAARPRPRPVHDLLRALLGSTVRAIRAYRRKDWDCVRAVLGNMHARIDEILGRIP